MGQFVHFCLCLFLTVCSIDLAITVDSKRIGWEDDEFHYGTFPEDFIWASASSSYQVEGAWDKDGKTPSIWDTFAQNGSKILDGTNGDVACDSYHKYMDDIKILKDMKMPYYRFSISWPRLFPNEGDTVPNDQGVLYYNTLIDELLKENIQSVVTIFHWDLPQWIHDKGGWLNEDLIVEQFGMFSRACFDKFGDRVKHWITINEPWVVAWQGYGTGGKAPGYTDSPGEDVYTVGHNNILAHAESYHIYDTEFRASQQGQIGITLNGGYSWPKDPNNPQDVAAADRNMAFDFGWFADPIFLTGEYPREMVERIGEKSRAEGRNVSRLPEFTPEQSVKVKGTSDFFGINFYSGALVEHYDYPTDEIPRFNTDKDLKESYHPSWPESGSGWLRVVPPSLRGIMNWIKDRYDNPPVFVTENGVSYEEQNLDDANRVTYFRGYINNMLKAMELDGCNAIGYIAWCLMDNYEWEFGYAVNFGIHLTNFSSPGLERIPKDSAKYLTQVVADNGFPQTGTSPSSTTPTNSADRFTMSLVLYIIVSALFVLRP